MQADCGGEIVIDLQNQKATRTLKVEAILQ